VNEFDGDVLRVRGIRSSPKREEAAAAQETSGHFPASFGEPRSFAGEKGVEDPIAGQQSLFDLRR
jgi:hypothetical protein